MLLQIFTQRWNTSLTNETIPTIYAQIQAIKIENEGRKLECKYHIACNFEAWFSLFEWMNVLLFECLI